MDISVSSLTILPKFRHLEGQTFAWLILVFLYHESPWNLVVLCRKGPQILSEVRLSLIGWNNTIPIGPYASSLGYRMVGRSLGSKLGWGQGNQFTVPLGPMSSVSKVSNACTSVLLLAWAHSDVPNRFNSHTFHILIKCPSLPFFMFCIFVFVYLLFCIRLMKD